VLLLEGGTLKRAQTFSQEQESRVNLRERGESSRNGYQGCFSHLLSGQRPKGVGGRSIYSPHLKKSRWEAFHRTSPVNPSGSRSQIEHVRSTRQVRCLHRTLESGPEPLESS
jgi:hypothetical protein